MVSCLLGSSRLFPGLLPASCGTLAPFRLCSRSQPQSSPWDLIFEARASAPSPRAPQWVSGQASWAGECWSTPTLCEGISSLCPLHPCCCTLLRGSKASHHPPNLPSPPVKGRPSVWELFLLRSSLPEVQVLSLFFCLCLFFFLLPYPCMWGVSCLLGSLRSSASIQQVFYRSCSTCRWIFDVFVGRKLISTSYSSTMSEPKSILISFSFLCIPALVLFSFCLFFMVSCLFL